jgi:hypothetical protein
MQHEPNLCSPVGLPRQGLDLRGCLFLPRLGFPGHGRHLIVDLHVQVRGLRSQAFDRSVFSFAFMSIDQWSLFPLAFGLGGHWLLVLVALGPRSSCPLDYGLCVPWPIVFVSLDLCSSWPLGYGLRGPLSS